MRAIIKLHEEDARYIEYLYKEFGKLMFAVARRFTKEKMNMEDIVSTTLIALMNNTQALQVLSYEDQQAYIAKAVITVSISFFRKYRTKCIKEIPIEALEGRTPDSKSYNIDERILLSSEIEMVICAIMQLPENERRCLQLKFLKYKNDEEIAAITGLSVNSIPQYIKRARKHLRILYTKEGGDNR